MDPTCADVCSKQETTAPAPAPAPAPRPPAVKASVPLPAALAPKRILRAEVVFGQFLAAGAFSRVHCGTWRGHRVALKHALGRVSEVTHDSDIIRQGRALHDDDYAAALYALVDEAALLAELPRHAHIVGLLGVVCDAEGVVLVLELGALTTAADVLVRNVRARASRSWASMAQICVEVASALERLHGLTPPVVHGDVATRNVLVDAAGCAKLVDFGLARRGGAELDSTLLNCSNRAADDVGRAARAALARGHEDDTEAEAEAGAEDRAAGLLLPLRIVAPEVLAAAGASDGASCRLTRASDVYAFGMLLYEVFHGAPPWGREAHPAAVSRLAVRGERPPLLPPPLLDAELAALIASCWQNNPALRPAMREVRMSLQAWICAHEHDRLAQEPRAVAEDEVGRSYVQEAAAVALLADEVAQRRRTRGSRRAFRGGHGKLRGPRPRGPRGRAAHEQDDGEYAQPWDDGDAGGAEERDGDGDGDGDEEGDEYAIPSTECF